MDALQKGWIWGWKRNGWARGKGKEELKNADLWQEIERLVHLHTVEWVKVKGHSDNELNNRCDKLATGEISARAKMNGNGPTQKADET